LLVGVFIDTERKLGIKVIFQTTAFSSVGQMIIRLCTKEKDIKTINFVRKEEQVKLLKEIVAD